MTLVELIVSKKLILLSIGLAFAPLLAAVTLIVVSRLKQNAARRARVKRAQAATRQAVMASVQQQAQASAEPAAPVQAQSTTPAGVQSTDRPPKTSPVPPEQPQEQPPEEDNTSEQAAPESPEMQDILSSVFAEDEVSTRYEALLERLDNIDVSELATRCNEVAHQMHAGSARAAQD
ncbi:MAG TPA: hypothetical protein VMT24_01965 [Aggregatilineaceae bacterium]|jgi:uncharacterized membrane protein|nr:hypothetical protein [Aggregatilineaceae bacterium]